MAGCLAPGARSVMRAPPPRITNLALLVALLIAFASGVGAVAAGTASGRWVAVAHGIVGVAVGRLVPWKARSFRGGGAGVRARGGGRRGDRRCGGSAFGPMEVDDRPSRRAPPP